MKNYDQRLTRLEIKAIPPAKLICFIQSIHNRDDFTSIDTATQGNRYNLTREQARALINPGDSVTWLLIAENRIEFEGPFAEQHRAAFEGDRELHGDDESFDL